MSRVVISDLWLDKNNEGLKAEICREWPELAEVLDEHCKAFLAIKETMRMRDILDVPPTGRIRPSS